MEAQLGIPMNGAPAPDFRDWEIKSHQVRNFARPGVGKVTLFTPEPDSGAYAEFGVNWFVEHFGVLNDAHNRYDFTGTHHVSALPHAKTGLTLNLVGYDRTTKTIQADGRVVLLAPNGGEVSAWTFAKLLTHWQRKHARAAYVPAQSQIGPPKAYRYGNRIQLAEGTRFDKFLDAMADGYVVYDPGIKSELLPSGRWRAKARSQFRIDFRALGALYDDVTEIDVLATKGA